MENKGQTSNLPLPCYCMNGEDLELLCFLIEKGGAHQLKERNEDGDRPIDLAEKHEIKDGRKRKNYEQFKTILEACNPVGGRSRTKETHPESGEYLKVEPYSIFVGCIRDLPLEKLKEIHESNRKAVEERVKRRKEGDGENLKLDVHRLDKVGNCILAKRRAGTSMR